MATLNPEVARALAATTPQEDAPAPPAPGDWRTRRTAGEEALAGYESTLDPRSSVVRRPEQATSSDGAPVPLRWYAPAGHDTDASGPAVLYLHGGGFILGAVDLYDRVIAAYVEESGVPMLAVDYRLAPEHPHPAPVEDCWAGLVRLVEQARGLGVDPQRVAVMGDSAGGGLAAGVALLARERGVALARQILVYPALDDRTTTVDPALAPFVTWTWEDNDTAWRCLLGDAAGTDAMPAAAASARAEELAALPAAYVEVGDLDILRDECVEHARRLAAAGCAVELHVHQGVPHGFDGIVPDAAVTQRARADRLRVLRSL